MCGIAGHLVLCDSDGKQVINTHTHSKNTVCCLDKLTFTLLTISSKDLNVEECLRRNVKTNFYMFDILFYITNSTQTTFLYNHTSQTLMVFYLIAGTLMVWPRVLDKRQTEQSLSIKSNK